MIAFLPLIMLAVEFAKIDVTVILSALFVAIPATIAAWASLEARKDMKTNNGKRPGQYIEMTHDRIGDLEDSLNSHLVSDNENFAEIRKMLQAQNTLSAQRAAPFLDASNPEEISP